MDKKLINRKRLHTNFAYKGSAHIYFLTLCTESRKPLFEDPKLAETIEKELEFRRDKEEIKLFCYCIMADHLHLLLSLGEYYHGNLQNWVSAFKRHTAKTLKDELNLHSVWQKNFFDHIVRKEETIGDIANYILNNPVRKGIVANWQEFPFSKMVDPLPT